jgi:hypothetical protein
LGPELRVDPTKGLVNAKHKHKTAERIHLGWKEMLRMFNRAEEDSELKDATTLPARTTSG